MTVNTVKSIIDAKEEIRIKRLGFLRDKTTADRFNARVITRNGKITVEELAVIAEAAKLYGNGEVTMTSRLTVEIQKIPYDKIEEVMAFLEQHGLETGGTGRKVRPVVSCKGTTCQYGLIDTFDLSKKIHEQFYKGYRKVSLPHKFKIAVGGCPNNCVKPQLNDLGVMGQRIPSIDETKCQHCAKCKVADACPLKIVKAQDGTVTIGEDCNNCGRCVGKCPFDAVIYKDGYKIFIGGRWGKKIDIGQPLDKIFETEEEVLATIEKAILFYKEQGRFNERFADTISRIGFKYSQETILGDRILWRKASILEIGDEEISGDEC